MRWGSPAEVRRGSCWQASWRWRGSTLPSSSGAPARTLQARARAVCTRAPSRFSMGASGARAGHCSHAVLIRPDGYVAWVGDLTQRGLADVLTTWFGGGLTD